LILMSTAVTHIEHFHLHNLPIPLCFGHEQFLSNHVDGKKWKSGIFSSSPCL